MTLTSKTIILLSLVGFALLLAGGMYFGSPLFGQLILGAIIAIFSVSQFRYYKALGHLETEAELLPQYKAQERPAPLGKGIIAKRIEVAASLAAKRVFPDPRVFSETLSGTESALVSRSPGGLVVMLGLMGTFYGLMVAVSTAGGTLNTGSNAATTLASVQQIFSSMQGIFGTSLAGLVAALVLNATHALLNGTQSRLLADIEEYTQFQLLPAFAPSNDPAERQMQLMVEKLGQVTLALQEGLQERNEQSLQMLRAQVEQSTLLLRDGLQSEIRSLSGELARMTGSYSQNLADSEKTARVGLQSVLEGFRDEFASLQKTAAQSLNETVQQVSAQIASTQDKAATGMLETVQTLTEKLGDLQRVAADGLRQSVADLSADLSRSALVQVESYQSQWKDMAQQANAHLDESREQWKAFMDSLKETSAESLVHQKEGLSTLRDVAEQVAVKALDESANLSATFATQIEKLSSEVQSSFGQLAVASRELVEAQGRLLSEMESRIAQEKDAAAGFSGDLGEAATLMRINQSEFQASLEMFRMGVEHILEKFTGNSAEQESQRNFIEQLHASLEAFHEKASEVLVENAMRTQEILLEILEQARPAGEGKAEA